MPLGQGGTFGYTSPFWNPTPAGGSDYGATPWGNAMLEKAPDVAFYRYLRGLGAPVETDTPFAKFLQSQYGNYLKGYGAYTVSNPLEATISGYTNTLPDLSAWQRQFMQQAPSLRGVNQAGYGAGPARWIS